MAQLFLTLPDAPVTALKNMNDEDDLTLEKMNQRFQAEEMKWSYRRVDSVGDKCAAFVGRRTKKPTKFTGKCHWCGVVGHMQRDCRQKPKKCQGEANAANEAHKVSFMVIHSEPVQKFKKLVFYVDSGCNNQLVI